MLNTMFRRAPFGRRLSVIKGRHIHTKRDFQIPYMENQLLIKMKDRRFSQYGIKILQEGLNRYKPLTLINALYIVHSNNMEKHMTKRSELQEAEHFINKVNNYKVVPIEEIMERLFSQLLLSLHYYSRFKIPLYREVLSHLDLLIKDYYFTVHDKAVPENVDLRKQTISLINFYHMGVQDTDRVLVEDREAFLLVERCLFVYMQSLRHQKSSSSIGAVKIHFECVMADTLSESSKALKTMAKPAAFIAKDFFSREPRSVRDMNIILPNAYEHIDTVVTISGLSIAEEYICLIDGCRAFKPEDLLSLTRAFLNSQSFNILSGEEKIILANKLMMIIPESIVRNPRNSNVLKHMLSCETFILSYLSEQFPGRKSKDYITAEGYLGLCTLFEKMRNPSTHSMFEALQNEYSKIAISKSTSEDYTKLRTLTPLQKRYFSSVDMNSLYAKIINLKLMIETDLENLDYELEQMCETKSGRQLLTLEPKIWTSYLISAKRLGANRHDAAIYCWRLYLSIVLDKYKDLRSVQIDASFIAELVYCINDIFYTMSILKKLREKKYIVNSTILVKWFGKLYSNATLMERRDIKSFNTIIDYTRSLYRSLDRKTPAIISTVLLGEARISPEQVYPLYRSELKGKRKDDNSLRALCLAAVTYHKKHNPDELIWSYGDQGEKKPCYEVCVMEFERLRAKHRGDIHAIHPSEKLWSVYIEMLVCYNLKTELMKCFSIFEEVGYRPEEWLLLEILVHIDPNDALRILRHGQKYMAHQSVPKTVRSESEVERYHTNSQGNISSGWPWPDEQVYANYKYDREQTQAKGQQLPKHTIKR